MKRMTAALLCLASSAQMAQAMEVTGGLIDLSYSTFLDQNDLDKGSVAGSVELAFARTFSVQIDAGSDSFGASGLDTLALGLHGIYHVDSATSLGAFFTHENADQGGPDDSIDYYGIEGGYDLGTTSYEGYLGRADGGGTDGTVFGVSGRYSMPNTIGVTGALDYVDIAGLEISTLSVRLDGDVSQNLNLFVEAGASKFDVSGVSDTEPFVGIGARVTFGANRGTTFERRSLGNILPGL